MTAIRFPCCHADRFVSMTSSAVFGKQRFFTESNYSRPVERINAKKATLQLGICDWKQLDIVLTVSPDQVQRWQLRLTGCPAPCDVSPASPNVHPENWHQLAGGVCRYQTDTDPNRVVWKRWYGESLGPLDSGQWMFTHHWFRS